MALEQHLVERPGDLLAPACDRAPALGQQSHLLGGHRAPIPDEGRAAPVSRPGAVMSLGAGVTCSGDRCGRRAPRSQNAARRSVMTASTSPTLRHTWSREPDAGVAAGVGAAATASPVVSGVPLFRAWNVASGAAA